MYTIETNNTKPSAPAILDYPQLITEQLQQLLEQRDQLKAELQELEDAGIANATPHYREGKYLYLIYPTQRDGSRERKYIGNKPEAIEQALAKVERFKIHASKKRELSNIESLLRTADYELNQVLTRLKRTYRTW
jgi:hypothetical protein